MKILALVFLFGFAAAISHEALERARDEAILSFMVGMEKAPSLQDAMGIYSEELDEEEEIIKSDLAKVLRNAFDDLVQHIKDAVDHGKTVKESMLENLKKIKEQLKDLHEDITTKAKQLLERIKEKAKGKLREWMEKWGLKKKDNEVAFGQAFPEKLKELLKDVREKLSEKGADVRKVLEEFKEKLKDHAMVIQLLFKDVSEKTVEKVKEMIDTLLNKRKESRSVKDLYEKIKDYLEDARDDFKQHYSKFLNWLENVFKSGEEAAKGRIENLKKVALKFLDHVKEVGKKTADEALEFFRPYKEDLGTLWDELEKSIKKAYGEH